MSERPDQDLRDIIEDGWLANGHENTDQRLDKILAHPKFVALVKLRQHILDNAIEEFINRKKPPTSKH